MKFEKLEGSVVVARLCRLADGGEVNIEGVSWKRLSREEFKASPIEGDYDQDAQWYDVAELPEAFPADKTFQVC